MYAFRWQWFRTVSLCIYDYGIFMWLDLIAGKDDLGGDNHF
ncbi:unnamed protein product [Amoebophrya sp. A120]|nr:unnamed protein product [Amoebophrya sp. A120]|eukprot:GSA120T00011183001.1